MSNICRVFTYPSIPNDCTLFVKTPVTLAVAVTGQVEEMDE